MGTTAVAALAAGGLVMVAAPAGRDGGLGLAQDAKLSAAESERVRSGLLKAPLAFVANTGSLDERVAFWLPGQSATVYLTEAGLTYRLSRPAARTDAQSGPAWVVRQDFVGASPVRPVAVQDSPSKVDDRLAFWLPESSASGYLTDSGLTYRLSAAAGPAWVVRQDFVGAATVRRS